MADVLERVNKLIALTSSTSEHEARTAALQACRLIREHGLAVIAPPNGASASPRYPWDEPHAHVPPPPSASARGDQARQRVAGFARVAEDFLQAFADGIDAQVAARAAAERARRRRERDAAKMKHGRASKRR